MSWSTDVKAELARQMSRARHCQLAEIAAILTMCGRVSISTKGNYSIRIYSENAALVRKISALLMKAFKIRPEAGVRAGVGGAGLYMVGISNKDEALKVLTGTRLIDSSGEIRDDVSLVSNLLLQKECCRRAYLRGAYLAVGTMSNPQGAYHFELVLGNEELAQELMKLMTGFGIAAKMVKRKRQYVVYVKEGSGIVDILNIMEAHVSLMELENMRILKEMRNQVNRQVNCETANIHKTVSAAMKQVEEIKFLMTTPEYDELSASLKEACELRLEYPEASLTEIGELMNPPVGKSGVNHRLRRISELANKCQRSFDT